jgi:hypothetical protein
MSNNYIETWQKYAPKEIRFDDRGILPLKDNSPSDSIYLDATRSCERDILQGYLQRCIVERAWVFVLHVAEYSVAEVKCGQVWESRSYWGNQSRLIFYSLLSAYCEALIREEDEPAAGNSETVQDAIQEIFSNMARASS